MTDARRLGWNEIFDPTIVDSSESGVPFLSVAQALADHATIIAEVGCGRGGQSELSSGQQALQDFRGTGRTVIGIDVDPVGVENPMIDEFRLIETDGRWPLPEESVDLAISDWTLEHVVDPWAFVGELARTLRPGGAFVARTVSRHSPLSIAARTVPNNRHAQVLSVLQPGREAKDVFPTEYRMNSRAAIAALFDSEFDWALSHRSDLGQYFLRWPRAARTISVAEPHLPKALRSTLVIYARKR